ncbi:MAG: hypothetical protein U1F52_18465 [Burkholderiales bacterium]
MPAAFWPNDQVPGTVAMFGGFWNTSVKFSMCVTDRPSNFGNASVKSSAAVEMTAPAHAGTPAMAAKPSSTAAAHAANRTFLIAASPDPIVVRRQERL